MLCEKKHTSYAKIRRTAKHDFVVYPTFAVRFAVCPKNCPRQTLGTHKYAIVRDLWSGGGGELSGARTLCSLFSIPNPIGRCRLCNDIVRCGLMLHLTGWYCFYVTFSICCFTRSELHLLFNIISSSLF